MTSEGYFVSKRTTKVEKFNGSYKVHGIRVEVKNGFANWTPNQIEAEANKELGTSKSFDELTMTEKKFAESNLTEKLQLAIIKKP